MFNGVRLIGLRRRRISPWSAVVLHRLALLEVGYWCVMYRQLYGCSERFVYLQGGGHSFLSPSFGLGADNVLEMNLVTPDAKLRIISECSNPELFWAVRRDS